jgi:hypothetical protein
VASEEYWQQQKDFARGKHGPLSRVPMEEAALLANGPPSRLDEVLRLLIVGLADEARACLEFVPRLDAVLADPHALDHLPAPQRDMSRGCLPEALHLGIWLRDGQMDPARAGTAYEHFLAFSQSWGDRFTQPSLHTLMLLSIESNNPSSLW